MTKHHELTDWRRGRSPIDNIPPAMFEESVWDILLALLSDEEGFGLKRLAHVVSLPGRTLLQWLGTLEQHGFVTAVEPAPGDRRAILTGAGRQMLERYLCASSELQLGRNS